VNLPPLYLITDAERVGDDRMIDVVVAASRAGLGMLQVREKTKSASELRDFVGRIRDHTEGALLWILNHPDDLVDDLDMDGLHLGGGKVERIGEIRKSVGEGRILGYSAHEVDEIRRAFELGASYVSYSPVLPTHSKLSYGPPLGLDAFATACGHGFGPIYALGGVGASSAVALRERGAAGLAVIGAIADADDPERATREILSAWDGG